MAYFTDQMGEEFRKAIEDAMANSEELDDPGASKRAKERKDSRRTGRDNRAKKRKTKRRQNISKKHKGSLAPTEKA